MKKTALEVTPKSGAASPRTADTPRTKLLKDVRQKRLSYFESMQQVSTCDVVHTSAASNGKSSRVVGNSDFSIKESRNAPGQQSTSSRMNPVSSSAKKLQKAEQDSGAVSQLRKSTKISSDNPGDDRLIANRSGNSLLDVNRNIEHTNSVSKKPAYDLKSSRESKEFVARTTWTGACSSETKLRDSKEVDFHVSLATDGHQVSASYAAAEDEKYVLATNEDTHTVSIGSDNNVTSLETFGQLSSRSPQPSIERQSSDFVCSSARTPKFSKTKNTRLSTLCSPGPTAHKTGSPDGHHSDNNSESLLSSLPDFSLNVNTVPPPVSQPRNSLFLSSDDFRSSSVDFCPRATAPTDASLVNTKLSKAVVETDSSVEKQTSENGSPNHLPLSISSLESVLGKQRMERLLKNLREIELVSGCSSISDSQQTFTGGNVGSTSFANGTMMHVADSQPADIPEGMSDDDEKIGKADKAVLSVNHVRLSADCPVGAADSDNFGTVSVDKSNVKCSFKADEIYAKARMSKSAVVKEGTHDHLSKSSCIADSNCEVPSSAPEITADMSRRAESSNSAIARIFNVVHPSQTKASIAYHRELPELDPLAGCDEADHFPDKVDLSASSSSLRRGADLGLSHGSGSFRRCRKNSIQEHIEGIKSVLQNGKNETSKLSKPQEATDKHPAAVESLPYSKDSIDRYFRSLEAAIEDKTGNPVFDPVDPALSLGAAENHDNNEDLPDGKESEDHDRETRFGSVLKESFRARVAEVTRSLLQSIENNDDRLFNSVTAAVCGPNGGSSGTAGCWLNSGGDCPSDGRSETPGSRSTSSPDGSNVGLSKKPNDQPVSDIGPKLSKKPQECAFVRESEDFAYENVDASKRSALNLLPEALQKQLAVNLVDLDNSMDSIAFRQSGVFKQESAGAKGGSTKAERARRRQARRPSASSNVLDSMKFDYVEVPEAIDRLSDDLKAELRLDVRDSVEMKEAARKNEEKKELRIALADSQASVSNVNQVVNDCAGGKSCVDGETNGDAILPAVGDRRVKFVGNDGTSDGEKEKDEFFQHLIRDPRFQSPDRGKSRHVGSELLNSRSRDGSGVNFLKPTLAKTRPRSAAVTRSENSNLVSLSGQKSTAVSMNRQSTERSTRLSGKGQRPSSAKSALALRLADDVQVDEGRVDRLEPTGDGSKTMVNGGRMPAVENARVDTAARWSTADPTWMRPGTASFSRTRASSPNRRSLALQQSTERKRKTAAAAAAHSRSPPQVAQSVDCSGVGGAGTRRLFSADEFGRYITMGRGYVGRLYGKPTLDVIVSSSLTVNRLNIFAAAASQQHLLQLSPRIHSGELSMMVCLPDELLLAIFTYLPLSDIGRCASVCRHFYRVAMDSCLWRRITLRKKTLTDEHLAAIGRHQPTSLELIQCRGDGVTQDGVRDLFRQCSESLKELNITGCTNGHLSGDALLLHASSRCRHITHLDASWTNVGTSGVIAVCDSSNRLRAICLNGCQTVADEAVCSLVQKHGHSLVTLELFGLFSLTHVSLDSIAQNCPNLVTLNLGQCWKLTDASIAQLSNSLRSVENLDLRGCKQINDHAVQQVVRNCGRLLTLSLSSCASITDRSLVELAACCPGLRSLDVSGCNKISNVGVKTAASGCTALTLLDLSNTPINHRSITAVADSCRALESLKINYCKQISVDSLVKLARNCRRLSKLYMYGVTSVRSTDEILRTNPGIWIER